MQLSRPSRWGLAAYTGFMLLLLYVPLAMIGLLSFNTAKSVNFPPKGFTTKWWSGVLDLKGGPKDALESSAKLALIAALIAIVLGTLLAFALHRFEFFGRNAVSFLVVLPIALPGIVTGVALRNAFVRFGVDFGFLTVVIGHATFCIVIAFNNVIARLRRLSPSLQEASADLGADGLQTFLHVTFPLARSSIVAGAILAFALSFDEVVVTTFTAGAGVETLPQWFLGNLSRPNNVPYVNVVATAVMVVSIPIAWLAQRLSDGAGTPAGALGGGR